MILIQKVYPPCDTSKFETVFSDNKHDENFFISSVGQFRPEKNHQLQIKAFSKFIEKYCVIKIFLPLLNELNN
jgi:alpha-1,2-mannosyltransferase